VFVTCKHSTNLPNFMELGTYCTHILKLFSQHFLKVQLIDSVVVKTLLLFIFLIFHATIKSEILKMFEDKKIYFRTLMRMNFVCSMVVPCNCCILFELS
jgi:ubiquitin-protein ligase